MLMDTDNPILLKPIAIKVLSAIILLWLIKGLQIAFSWDLGVYGVYPRELDGLLGILFAPIIHGSFEHLFSNTMALFVLVTALFYEYPKSAKYTFLIVYFGSGLGVWLFARESYHYGASGLTHGLMFFLFLIGVLRRDKPAMALSLIVFFLYGSMVWGILPTKEEISFEAHLFGALMGIICAIIFRNKDPKPPEKKYSWEQDEDAVEENVSELKM
ncbi:MAG: rhomboid family intramembrane serine protease [Gammaproteobacteria bacterium]|nr:MAG: rhomboid family intramembrane serine protease [Gammaproteobacteria bacterium]